MVQCKYCNTEFKTNYIMKNHMKTAKYCLIKQGRIENKEKKFQCNFCDRFLSTKHWLENHIKICREKTFDCEYCKETLSSKNNLILHLSSCVKKFEFIIENLKKTYKQELKEKDNQIKELQDKLERICVKAVSKSTITNNTINNNNNKYINLAPLVLDKNEIKKCIEKEFSEHNYLDGQKGVAEFTYNNFLFDKNNKESKYVCNNISKNIFTYKDKKGKFHIDIGANSLTSLIADDIINKSKVIREDFLYNSSNLDEQEFYNKPLCDIEKIKTNNGKFVKHLVKLTSNNNLLIESDVEYEFVIEE